MRQVLDSTKGSTVSSVAETSEYARTNSVTVKFTSRFLQSGHINICSLRNKVNNVHFLIHKLDLDVLALSETWLNDSDSNASLHIPGFRIFRRDRLTGNHGGVCIYIKDTIPCSIIPIANPHNLEALFLHLRLTSTELAFGCIYRPPSSPVAFWDHLHCYFDEISERGPSTCITAGDFNVDMLKPTGHHYQHLIDLFADFNFKNVIQDPTRIPSLTCLDLFLVPNDAIDTPPNCCRSDATAYSWKVLPSGGISDHLVTKLWLGLPAPIAQVQHHMTYRKPKLSDVPGSTVKTALMRSFSSYPPSTTEPVDLDNICSAWQQCIVAAHDECAPVHRRISKPNKPRPQPWVTPHLQHLFHRRSHLHRAALRDPSTIWKFRAVRRESTLLNRRLKREFYLNEFRLAKNNPRKQWKLINLLSGRANVTQAPAASINSVATHLASVVTDDNRPTVLHTPQGPMPENCLTEFADVTPDQVERLLATLNQSKSAGSDGIPASLLKCCAKELSTKLADIFNESLRTGYVPDVYKVASVTPIFKGGDATLATNYRPISLLPIVSKLLEKLVLGQLGHHIQLNPHLKVIPNEQFAYRPAHSTEDLLCYAINTWQQHLEAGKAVGVLYLDMSKAFDRIKHQRMIEELFNCGISGIALKWFTSYLSCRYQQVIYKQTDTRATPTSCSRGVPQGSVLGPVLFTIYTRNVSRHVSYSQPLQYADDICLSLPRDPCDLPEITRCLSEDYKSLEVHFSELGLLLNDKKSEFMVIHRKSIMLPSPICVTCGSVSITATSSCRYLGLLIDDQLTFGDYVQYLRADIAKKLGAFRRSRGDLDLKARRTFYLSIIQSKLEYASNSYVHCLSQTNYDQLMSLSRRALRIIFGFPYRADVNQILLCNNITYLATRVQLRLYLFTYRCIHGLGSPLLSGIILTRDKSFHTSACTRSQSSFGLALPNVSSRYGFFSLSFLAADRYNSLPASVRSAPSFAEFRSLCMSHILGYPVKRP